MDGAAAEEKVGPKARAEREALGRRLHVCPCLVLLQVHCVGTDELGILADR